MSDGTNTATSWSFASPADPEPTAVICDECEHKFDADEHFFRCQPCRQEQHFDLCQQCALKDLPCQESHWLRPCILDNRDSKPTFLPRPDLAEFRSLMRQYEQDSSSMLPAYVRDFALPTLIYRDTMPEKSLSPGGNQKRNATTLYNITVVENDYSKYVPLDAEKKDIRLFNLFRGSGDSPVEGIIARFSFPWDQVQWTALSYCWGDLTATRMVGVSHLVNRLHDGNAPNYSSQILHITANLEMALRNLRSADQHTWLWIDALCINQGDLDERASQAGMMRDIYSHAAQVGIWLGLSASDLLNATFVRVIGLAAEDGRKQYESEKTTVAMMMNLAQTFKLSAGDKTVDAAEIVRALSSFFSNPWFVRVWVLQEVWSARQDVLVLARQNFIIRWRHVVDASLFLTVTMSELRTGAVGKADLKHLIEPWDDISSDVSKGAEHRRYLPILRLVSAVCRNFKATDDRDKIFALLAMARETHEIQHLPDLIKINYRKSIVEVFSNFTRWCILEHRSLQVLGHVKQGDRPSEEGEEGDALKSRWPSWTLSPCPKDAPISTLGSIEDFSAAADTPIDLEPVQRSDQPFQLKLRGYKLSTVSLVEEKYFTIKWHITDELCLDDDATSTWYEGGMYWLWHTLSITKGLPNKECHPLDDNDICSCQGILDEALMLLTYGGWDNHGNCDHIQGIHRPKWMKPADLYADFAAYWVHQREGKADPNMESFCEHVRQMLQQLMKKGTPQGFLKRLVSTASNKCLFKAESGRLGLCPPGTRVGDSVVALFGGRAPYVLRALGTEDDEVQQWEFIGECYLRGAMHGHKVKVMLEQGTASETFTVV